MFVDNNINTIGHELYYRVVAMCPCMAGCKSFRGLKIITTIASKSSRYMHFSGQ